RGLRSAPASLRRDAEVDARDVAPRIDLEGAAEERLRVAPAADLERGDGSERRDQDSRARRGRRGAQSSDERRERDRRREDGQVDVPVGDGRDRLVVEGDQPEDRQERGGEDPGGEEPCAASRKEREEEEDGDREEAVPAKAGL